MKQLNPISGLISRQSDCRKFEKLVLDSEDRSLSSRELTFVESHKNHCTSCERFIGETFASLTALRNSKDNYEGVETFDLHVVRMVKVQAGRDTWKYWLPAVLSAGIAAIAAFALMQLLSGTTYSKPIIFRDRSAMNSTSTFSPRLVYPPTR